MELFETTALPGSDKKQTIVPLHYVEVVERLTRSIVGVGGHFNLLFSSGCKNEGNLFIYIIEHDRRN